MSLVDRVSNWFEEATKWHSSPIDWCEPNYQVTPSIAEFYNTLTSAIYAVYPPALMLLFRPYTRRVSYRVQFAWLLMIVVGFTSIYFHATLSLTGQLVDEYSIIWVFSACVAFYTPPTMLPRFLRENKAKFEFLMLVIAVLLTLLGVIWPILNSFLMMFFGIPVVVRALQEMRKSDDKELKYVAKHAAVCWGLAAAVWVSDRALCGAWLRVGLPGGHWLWHLIIAMSSYRAMIIFIYLDAVRRHPDAKPRLAYWPSRTWRIIGLLYVDVDPLLPTPGGKSSTPVSEKNNNLTNRKNAKSSQKRS